MMRVKASDILQEMMDLIPDEDHWWRGTPMMGSITEAECGITALSKSTSKVRPYAHDVRDRVRTYIMNDLDIPVVRGTESRTIQNWNDDPSTTFEDFRLTLKRAKSKAEENGD